jgi:hypothetical protein
MCRLCQDLVHVSKSYEVMHKGTYTIYFDNFHVVIIPDMLMSRRRYVFFGLNVNVVLMWSLIKPDSALNILVCVCVYILNNLRGIGSTPSMFS